MGKREKVMFTIFVVIVQVLQFLLVYSIAWLNNRTITIRKEEIERTNHRDTRRRLKWRTHKWNL